MIGDEYIEQRAELGTALYVLAGLAHDAGCEVDVSDLVHQLNTSLREPFLFMVVGEVKAGKSSLLNALFGRDFCRVDVLPATDRVCVFKYGGSEREVQITPQVTEFYRPISFLQDFNIVDTPGTNTIAAGHEEITNRYLPLADLVLFVFAITNPWGASAWEFLDRVQNKWLKNVAFVVQQTDLRDPMEIDAVVAHLRQTAVQRLGRECPIFPVSAKNAILAKTTGIDKDRLWEASRFGALESYINHTVADGENRRGKLVSICRTARTILKQASDQLRGTHSTLDRDLEQLAALSKTMVWMEEQTLRQVDGLLRGIEQAYVLCEEKGYSFLESKLGFWQTLKLTFGKGNWQQQFHAEVDTNLRQTIQKKVEDAVRLLQAELENVWEQLDEAVVDGFSERDDARGRQLLGDFKAQREKVLTRVELKIAERMSSAAIEEQLGTLLDQTSRWVRLPVGAAAAGVAGVAAAKLYAVALADVTGVLAATATIFGSVVAVAKRRNILETYRARMEEKRKEVISEIESQLQQMVRSTYRDFEATFQPLSSFCSTRKEKFTPLVERLTQLESTFQRISAKLGVQ